MTSEWATPKVSVTVRVKASVSPGAEGAVKVELTAVELLKTTAVPHVCAQPYVRGIVVGIAAA